MPMAMITLTLTVERLWPEKEMIDALHFRFGATEGSWSPRQGPRCGGSASTRRKTLTMTNSTAG